MFEIKNIYDDERTWDLFKSGRTVGCFQLEKPYTGEWCHKIQPNKVEDLADILSIIRPGTTKAVEDGKSMTQHYVDRKNGSEIWDCQIPDLKTILGDTWGVLTFQEQAMQIAMQLAGFTEQQADVLRKAIGHKDTDIMSKLESEFLEGVKATGKITLEQGKEVFENIRKSQRYSFNKSHAIAYAKNCYNTGFCKANYPLEFFCVYLQYAKERLDPFEEIRILVNDAKDFGIEVRGPYLPDLKDDFYIRDNRIYFGLSNIKGVGVSHVKQLIDLLGNADITNMGVEEVLVKYLTHVNKTVAKNLVRAGALDYLILKDTTLSRSALQYYLDLLWSLTSKEIEWLTTFGKFSETTSFMVSNLRGLSQPKATGGGVANGGRAMIVEELIKSWTNPPYKLVDTPEGIATAEQMILGISVTCHITESYEGFEVTDYCQDVRNSKKKNFNLGVSIIRVSEQVVKKGASAGQLMAFLSADDKTGSVNDLIVFADVYAQYKDLLTSGNVVGISGTRSQKNGLIVNKVWEL